MDLREGLVTQVWQPRPSRRPDMHGKRSPARLPPRLNRGAAAWDRDESDFSVIWLSSRHSLVLPVVTRAQVHAVTDTTNQEYLAIVDAVLDEIESGIRQRKWIPPSSLVELDAILSAICDQLIYVQRKGPAHGQKLHAAWSHVYPNQITGSEQLHSCTVHQQERQSNIRVHAPRWKLCLEDLRPDKL